MQVLLVEDNEINMEIAEFYLTERGAAVAKAWNGREAVEKVKAEPRRFDVVLMDVMMPVLDGLAATREIRALPYPAAGVPILAMTAQDTREAEQECKDAGMNDYLASRGPDRMAEKILHWTRQQAETSSRHNLPLLDKSAWLCYTNHASQLTRFPTPCVRGIFMCQRLANSNFL